MPRKVTTEDFIERARKVHGDRYDYSHVAYAGSLAKVLITCSEHGDFPQAPKKHLSGNGCPVCARRLGGKTGRSRLTTEEFIRRAREVHGDTFDYSKSECTGAEKKITIICREHGEFRQKAGHHIRRAQGCPECKGQRISEAKYKGLPHFLAEARKTHSDCYDYSKATYTGPRDPLTIICREHGEFQQSPNNHIRGRGCPKCANAVRNVDRIKTTEEFIADARKVHGDKYDYSEAEYTRAYEKVKIICPEHGPFYQAAGDHTQGAGCRYCIDADYGFDYDAPAILYYLRINTRNQTLYKLGITNRTVEERFPGPDQELITVLDVQQFDIGREAYDAEQELLKRFSDYQYRGAPVMMNTGRTELFTRDVLCLDRETA